MDDPTAPLGHHWQDATHISFGVLTAGIFGYRWKLEGSLFNGREPNEKRWDFDKLRLNSYSARLTANPDSQWSITLGYGYLKEPEVLEPAHSIRRFSASLLHGRKLGPSGQWATTAIWGANAATDDDRLTHSVLLESEAMLDQKNTVLTRAEVVQKSAAELVLSDGFSPERLFTVGHYSLGYIREVSRVRRATVGVGVRATLNFVPAALEAAYGSRTPTGLIIFLRLRPWHEALSPEAPAHIHDR